MATIFGALGLPDTDRSFVNTIGQRVVYEATSQLLAQYNAELNAALSVFVGETTSNFKYRYKLPGGGRLQRRGRQGMPGAKKASGSWDVAFPLEDFGDIIAGDDISLAYMTLQEYQRHLDSVMIADKNTVRFELLKALLNSNQDTFEDEINGSLSIEPLANGDSVTYPPVLGSESEATDNHYLESNYAASAISDTNNPYVTLRDELEEHFGATQGGSNIVVWINNAQTAKTEALTDFSEVPDRFVRIGQDTDYAESLPAGLPGERVIGRTNGVWVVEWRFIPANYMLALHLDAIPPLVMREDPADTGLGSGLQLVSQGIETMPFQTAFWRHRFGFGCGNRLNGAVMELGTGGSYTIPSAYS